MTCAACARGQASGTALQAAGSNAARCDITLTHYGNADLTVTACDLVELPETETSSTAPLRAPARRAQIVIVGNCQAYFVHEGFRRAPPP